MARSFMEGSAMQCDWTFLPLGPAYTFRGSLGLVTIAISAPSVLARGYGER